MIYRGWPPTLGVPFAGLGTLFLKRVWEPSFKTVGQSDCKQSLDFVKFAPSEALLRPGELFGEAPVKGGAHKHS